MSLTIKICGLSTPDAVDAAVEAGADLVGFVFHPKSPRFVTQQVASSLCARVQGHSRTVALVVDPDDTLLRDIAGEMKPDMIQLHGREAPARVNEIAQLMQRPVIKAVGVGSVDDLGDVLAYRDIGATLLIDAKPPKDAAYPGGHGRPFDWSLLKALPGDLPFMLSGGLTPETVAGAIRTVRGYGLALAGVDVSSGVETAPGRKDLGLIRAFVAAARAAG